MDVEIITIGDELLLGQVVDTNSAWMATELAKEGFRVNGIITVGDEADDIKETVQRVMQKADIILLTGGLGPTKDDITLQTLCELFETKLVFSPEVYKDIEHFISNRTGAMNSLNRAQAMVPESAVIIHNTVGTAPVTWFERNGKVLVSMPGVPAEMKKVMSEEIIPRLKNTFKVPSLQHRHIIVQGISESALALKLEAWENALPPHIKLAYLPQVNLIRLRLTATRDNGIELSQELDYQVQELYKIAGDAILATEDIPIEQIVGNVLREKKLTVATAESCTGGNIAHLITLCAGSSDYFKGGVIAYSNEIKQNVLHVPPAELDTYGAVSQQIVEKMATGARTTFQTDLAVATSGIAGPDGGTPQKPVGTVWIAVASARSITSRCFHFGIFRDRNITSASIAALAMVKQEADKL